MICYIGHKFIINSLKMFRNSFIFLFIALHSTWCLPSLHFFKIKYLKTEIWFLIFYLAYYVLCNRKIKIYILNIYRISMLKVLASLYQTLKIFILIHVLRFILLKIIGTVYFHADGNIKWAKKVHFYKSLIWFINSNDKIFRLSRVLLVLDFSVESYHLFYI